MLLKCLIIFLARVMDVSLGTLRTVYSVKGKTMISTFISFVEILIWYAVAKEALNAEGSSILIAIFYALGYSVGTLLGTYIANNYVHGFICLQVITKKYNNDVLIEKIKNKGYGLSIISLRGYKKDEEKELLLIEINKKSLNELIKIIKNEDEKAFIMISESKLAENGVIK